MLTLIFCCFLPAWPQCWPAIIYYWGWCLCYCLNTICHHYYYCSCHCSCCYPYYSNIFNWHSSSWSCSSTRPPLFDAPLPYSSKYSPAICTWSRIRFLCPIRSCSTVYHTCLAISTNWSAARIFGYAAITEFSGDRPCWALLCGMLTAIFRGIACSVSAAASIFAAICSCGAGSRCRLALIFVIKCWFSRRV